MNWRLSQLDDDPNPAPEVDEDSNPAQEPVPDDEEDPAVVESGWIFS